MKSKDIYNIILKLVLLSMIIMLMLTFIMAKHIDTIRLSDAKLYPIYYFLKQPTAIWVAVPLALVLITFSSRSSYRLLAILSLAFLIEFLPSFMMINPWLPDQYPYLSEAYWIYLYGNISNVHYLSYVPGLGLLYGIYEIIISLHPFIISKAFSLIQAIVVIVMLAIISRELTNNETLLPLLFLSFNYFADINVFHRSSQHFTLTLVFLYVILAIVLKPRNFMSRHLLLSAIIFGSMVLTYPGSGYILATIVGAYLISYIVKNKPSTLSVVYIAVFINIFAAWYGYVSWREIRIAGSIWNSLIKVFQLEWSFEESATHPFSTGLTSLFRTLIILRLIIEGGVILIGFVIALYKTVSTLLSHSGKEEQSNNFVIYYLTLASLIAPAPWFLTEWSRWSFYKFSHYFLLFSLLSILSYIHSQHRLTRVKLFPSSKILSKILVFSIIIIALFLVPLLRYASIPYLHVTTEELSSVYFVHQYFTFSRKCYYFEYTPYILPRLILRGEYLNDISSIYWFENITSGLYIITDRALTRDGFYIYPQPLKARIMELENFMIIHGNKVYDNIYNRAFYLVKEEL
jgi:hypothetical protein